MEDPVTPCWGVPDLQEWRVISECCFKPLNCGQLCDSVENENIKPTSSSLAETAAPGIILGHEKSLYAAAMRWCNALQFGLFLLENEGNPTCEQWRGCWSFHFTASIYLLPSKIFVSIDSGSSMTSSNLWSLVIHRDTLKSRSSLLHEHNECCIP